MGWLENVVFLSSFELLVTYTAKTKYQCVCKFELLDYNL